MRDYWRMPVLRSLARGAATTVRGTRATVRSGVSTGRWVTRRVGRMRARGAAGEAGMIRLFDLHAISTAGDTLIAIGLAGTIFFTAPLGEARGQVALYLLVTMVPFAVLAPLIGPLLDHFRHGRRYALAATMLGRAFLAWLASDYLDAFGLFPAAFGVLVLSRAYGVARAAAVPRLLPEGLGLSQANARGSLYGTVAGAAVAPLGLATFWFGPQWPLRVASVIFVVGMVIALRLPPRADSDSPEAVPRLISLPWLVRRDGERLLTGRLVLSALAGSAAHRALYGFLLLFLAFVLKAGDLPTDLFGAELSAGVALGVVTGALVTGTFLAVVIGSRLRIHRPVAMQAGGIGVAAILAVGATIRFTLPMVALLCLVAAVSSGLAKLSVDAAIQERIDERWRAGAFAHSETLLMLAWVAGGALGLIPVAGRVGVGAAAGLLLAAGSYLTWSAWRLRGDRLNGRPVPGGSGVDAGPPDAAADHGPRGRRRRAAPSHPAAAEPAADPAPPAHPPSEGDPLAPPGYHIYRPSRPAAVPGPPTTGSPGADPPDHPGAAPPERGAE
jgi:MFS family permease